MLNHPAVILIVAFGTDLLIGDPVCPLHPVRLFGKMIGFLERWLRGHCRSLKIASILLPLFLIAGALTAYRVLMVMTMDAGWIINLLITYFLLALKDLSTHANAVRDALIQNDLPMARSRVQLIAGRDVNRLDRHGIARATIESVAENFVDGFLAPVFWYTIGALLFRSAEGGVSLLIAFKAISTLDSMVGYKNERYMELGRISAHLDDVMNFIPARLSIPLIALCSKKRKAAWRIGLRDRLKHASPNSAHTEAAAAGALGLRLGGPADYPHGTVDRPWLGDGAAEATPENIDQAVKLIQISSTISILSAALILL